MKKSIIIIISVALVFLALFLYLFIQNRNMVAVLTYHSVLDSDENNSTNGMSIDTSKFEHQIKLLKKLGYKSMSLKEFYCWKNKTCKLKGKHVLITFDDGYLDNYTNAVKILKKYDMKAVIFVIGKTIEHKNDRYLDIETIEKMKKEYPNIEIASHTYNLHSNRRNKTYEEINNDIQLMRKVIDTDYIAYPNGVYDDTYIKALKDNKYKMAFTFGPRKDHRKCKKTDDNYKIPRLFIDSNMPDYKFILRLILPI